MWEVKVWRIPASQYLFQFLCKSLRFLKGWKSGHVHRHPESVATQSQFSSSWGEKKANTEQFTTLFLLCFPPVIAISIEFYIIYTTSKNKSAQSAKHNRAVTASVKSTHSSEQARKQFGVELWNFMCTVPMDLTARTTGCSDMVQINRIPGDFPQLQPCCGQRLSELRIERKQARVT